MSGAGLSLAACSVLALVLAGVSPSEHAAPHDAGPCALCLASDQVSGVDLAPAVAEARTEVFATLLPAALIKRVFSPLLTPPCSTRTTVNVSLIQSYQ